MKKSYLLLLLTSVITADPELYFIEPKDGETYPKEVAVKFGLKDFGVAPAGYNIPNTGHHHLIINNAYKVQSFENQPIPYGANILHFGGGQKEAELSLPPGKYSLQLAIGDYEHKPINRNRSDQKYNPILSEIINVEILP